MSSFDFTFVTTNQAMQVLERLTAGVSQGLKPNAPRSDRIFADDALMPNKYCPMPVLAPDKETALPIKTVFVARPIQVADYAELVD